MSSLKNTNSCPLDLAILRETQVAPVVLPDPSFPPSPLTFHHLLQVPIVKNKQKKIPTAS